MHLTSFTDYCLRALIFVATRPEGRATIAEIARGYGISEHHLVKVVHRLGKEGLLLNTRGRGGGLALARAPRDINVGDLVRRIEGNAGPVDCSRCTIAPVCKLATALAEALAAFHAVLDRYTLEDLVRNRAAVTSILHPMTRTA